MTTMRGLLRTFRSEPVGGQNAEDILRDILDVLTRPVLGVRFGSLEVAIVDDYDARPAPYLHDDDSILQIAICDLQSRRRCGNSHHARTERFLERARHAVRDDLGPGRN